MNFDQTQAFADQWNLMNSFGVGDDTYDLNMRVVYPGTVRWNYYNSPNVLIEEFVRIYNEVTNNV